MSPAADAPTVPDWLAEEPPPRGRVLRAGTSDLRPDELRPADLQLVPIDRGDVARRPDGERRGAEALAWATGHRQGYEQGRAEGLEAGRIDGRRSGEQVAREEARRGFETAMAGLEAALLARATAQEEAGRALAEQVVELALAVAGAVLDRELAVAADPGAEAIRRALGSLSDRADAVARLHPDDLAALQADPAELAPDRVLQLVADPTVGPGGCIVDAGPTRVDATVEGALDRVRALLEERR